MNGKPQQGLMRTYILLAMLVIAPFTAPISEAQQPDIVQEHWYHSWATLTYDIMQWNDDYPEVVKVVSAGTTVLGKNQWVLQITDHSVETKADGSPKDVVYIDGGHHGNEHLGTELAFLVAEYYIEGFVAGDEETIGVLQNTELHIMILLNADGNDIDNRWNTNAVDLNRNYDHHWTTEETRSGSGPFSEPETRNNAEYMKEFASNADLYVTMHTGTWILAFPWGFTGDMPSDWELFTHIADTIHSDIDADLPVQNANAGIYPTHGTSRDYGYGVMGFPTFTFETDDEQFLPGTAQSLSDRLSVELDVMKYLISNVYFWRARLNVSDFTLSDSSISATVVNDGLSTTSNASLWWFPENINLSEMNFAEYNEFNNTIIDGNRSFSFGKGEGVMLGEIFSVNASNSTDIEFNRPDGIGDGGTFMLIYQKRVIDVSQVVFETIGSEDVSFAEQVEDEYWLGGWGMFDPFSMIFAMLAAAWWLGRTNV